MVARISDSVAYFWNNTQKTAECWLWMGSVLGGSAYGILPVRGKRCLAHRFAWEIAHGIVPEGMCVRHLCHQPLCVRPAHLCLMLRTAALPNPIGRFWARVDKQGDCWLWTGAQLPNGYGSVRIQNKHWLPHRYAWTLTNGPIPTGAFLCHRCDTPLCVRPEHLFLGDHTANMHDMWVKNRGSRTHQARGSQQYNARLREEDIERIRFLHAAGTTQTALGREYNVCVSSINHIVLRKSWKHVP